MLMCVICRNRPAIRCCVIGQRGTVRDYCKDCIEEGVDSDNFGRCYECADGLHERCIGVPCQCECPVSPAVQRRQRIEDLEWELKQLRSAVSAETGGEG